MNEKKFSWQAVALTGYVGIWGFSNAVNNYEEQGLQVMTSWILIMALYFIPYVLMVGELGSYFSQAKSGVSSWIRITKNNKWAYFAAWTYFIVHIPYIAQKPQEALVGGFWFLFGDGDLAGSFPMLLQFLSLLVLIAFIIISSLGINSLKVLGTIAGITIFVMSLLYSILGISAFIFMDIQIATPDITLQSFIPTFDFTYVTTLALLLFSVGGVEKMSPYVKQTKNGAKNFPKAMIAIAIMVVISALLGTLTLGMMFNSNDIPDDLKMNGAYYAFDKLGEYYHIGSFFTRLYAFAVVVSKLTVLMIAIDAPLKMLLLEADEKYIPKAMSKLNKYGAPTRGYIFVGILSSIIIILPMIGLEETNLIYNWLLKLNSIVMPLRYMWVFIAYILLKNCIKRNKIKKINKDEGYTFINNHLVGKSIAYWCLLFTAFACIMGMVPESAVGSDMFYIELATYVLTPIILISLGAVFPIIQKLTK